MAGLFLPDGYPEIAKLLAAKAEQGTKVRVPPAYLPTLPTP